MARIVQIILEDDLDGSPAAETVSFSVEGTNYAIDLSEQNAAEFRTDLSKFVSAARTEGRGAGAKAKKATALNSGPSARDVRSWARAQGIEVNDRGRVQNEVIEQYLSAN